MVPERGRKKRRSPFLHFFDSCLFLGMLVEKNFGDGEFSGGRHGFSLRKESQHRLPLLRLPSSFVPEHCKK